MKIGQSQPLTLVCGVVSWLVMALPVIADVYRVTLNWTGAGRHAANVIHLQSTGTVAQTYTSLDALVTASMWDSVRSSMSVDTVEVLPLDGSAGSTIFSTGRPAKWSGVQSSGDFMVAPATLVDLYTGLRGAQHRGRIFLPFPAESAAADGFLNSGNRTTMQTAWTTFATALVGRTPAVGLVVASYRHASASGVTTINIRSALATQRRRTKQLL